MTAAAEHGPAPEVEKTFPAIRAVLLPEDHGDFDAACDRAMGEAVAQSSVMPLMTLLNTWHLIARATVQDPAGRRYALSRRQEFDRTGTLSALPGTLSGTAADLVAALEQSDQ